MTQLSQEVTHSNRLFAAAFHRLHRWGNPVVKTALLPAPNRRVQWQGHLRNILRQEGLPVRQAARDATKYRHCEQAFFLSSIKCDTCTSVTFDLLCIFILAYASCVSIERVHWCCNAAQCQDKQFTLSSY